VPVWGLQHLEANAIHSVGDQIGEARGGLPLAHTTPDRVGPDRVPKRRIPVLTAGDLNAKHTDWNSRLIRARVRSCVTTPTETPAWSVGRTPQPRLLTHTTRLPTSWIQLLSRTSSYRCIWLFCTQLGSPKMSLSIPYVDHPFEISWTAPISREWTGQHSRLALNTATPKEYRGKRRGNRQVRWGAHQRQPRAYVTKRRPRPDPRSFLTASIQDEILLKIRLRRQWQVTRDPALKAQANRLQRSATYRLNEWRNEQWSDTQESLDSEDESLRKMTNMVMRIPTVSPLASAGRTMALRFRESGRPSRQTWGSVSAFGRHSDLAVTEMVYDDMRAYKYAPGSKPKLTSPSESLQVIWGLKFGKAPAPKGIPNRVLRHSAKRAITFLTNV
jgi:hypothetical protein